MQTTHSSATHPGQISPRNALSQLRARLKARLQTRLQTRADRAAYRKMLDLDAHLLKDVGLSQADVVWAIHQVDDTDVGSELHAIRRRRPT